MKSFQQLKLDMEAGIDGMLVNETKKKGLILKKFLFAKLNILFCFINEEDIHLQRQNRCQEGDQP